MMKIILFMCFLFLSGCATTGNIADKVAELNLSDGASIGEAIVLGQQKLQDSESLSRFNISQPAVIDNIIIRGYPKYWFVEFPPRTYKSNFWKYLVVVRKKDGKVMHANPYRPLRVYHYDWVFEGKK